MLIEIYQFMRKHHAKIYACAFASSFQRLADAFMNNTVDGFLSTLKDFVSVRQGAAVWMYGCLSLALVWFVTEALIKRALTHQKTNREFSNIMEAYTDTEACGTQDKCVGVLSWGQQRTILYSKQILFGWKPDEIIAEYDDAKYQFKSGQVLSGFRQFLEKDDNKRIAQLHNNMQRVMLVAVSENFNREKHRIILKMKHTDYLHARYTWCLTGAGGENGVPQPRLKDFLDGREKYVFPNSLCMHLILETADRKVLSTVVSKAKENDYADSYAVTIGEQMNIEDLHKDGVDYDPNFITVWLKRALLEEFGIKDESFADLFEEDSFRILSVDYEGDIYNFSLVCVIKSVYSAEDFCDKVKSFMDNHEIHKIEPIAVDDIPQLLINKADGKNETSLNGKTYLCHPSTFLRLLVFYLHKKGLQEGSEKIVKYYKSARRK